MTENEIRERMAARLLSAQTPWGRARLNFYVKWKRTAWNFTTGLAYSFKCVFDIFVSVIALILLAARSGQIRLREPLPVVRQLLRLLHFDKIFEITP
jgi:hypothetical protein